MDISFIIVNYKSKELLSRCIAAIHKYAPNAEHEIILVNNDENPLYIDSTGNSLKIINNDENRGFAKACNIGAKEAMGNTLFFLNPDTEIKTLGIEDIVKKLDDPNIGIVAPRLVTPNGSAQSWSVGYEINVSDTVLNNLGYAKSKALWLRNTPGEVDWVSGAAFAISKKLFFECGCFDENFFMYLEDVDLCKRIRLLGKKVLLLPHVEVLHLGGQCYLDGKAQKQHYYQSQDYYFKKHFGIISAFFIKLLRKTTLLFNK